MISLRDTTLPLGRPAITLAQDSVPSTQLTFPSSSQAQSVLSPLLSTTSTSCLDTLPPGVGSREVRTIPKPLPKRRLKESSLSEHIKNRDLQWFKAHQQPAAARDTNIASPVVDPAAQAGMLVVLNGVAEAPATDKLRPSCMPEKTPPRSLPSGLMTAIEPTVVKTTHRSSTFAQVPEPVDVKQPNEEKIISTATGVATSYPQPQIMPRDSEIHPSGPTKNTDSPAPTEPPATPSDQVGVRDFSLSPVAIPQVKLRRFGGDMAVMMYRRGSARGTFEVTFNLNDIRYLQVARWVKRKELSL
ncbi:hypothetical protein DEU56DRAFT_981945, partial [Suillus clintonianus]|uniref:uncharacterized protein n=1 Tax=Suillus clintonianus TaxID=1904413 RepID=UPI001B86CAFA